ncbi:hypothetical protein G7046_g5478 [Stylonectria norvegica]|nr:hypothetical protein G7046_g5478 [Stylonectria norvegica]
MALLEKSPNIQEAETMVGKKRSHDEYSGDSIKVESGSGHRKAPAAVVAHQQLPLDCCEFRPYCLLTILASANLLVLTPKTRSMSRLSPQASPAPTESESGTPKKIASSSQTSIKVEAANSSTSTTSKTTNAPSKRSRPTPAEKEAKEKELADKIKERDEKLAAKAAAAAEKAAEKAKADEREEKKRKKEEELQKLQEEKEKKAAKQKKLNNFFVPSTPSKSTDASSAKLGSSSNGSPAKKAPKSSATPYEKLFKPFFLKENTTLAKYGPLMDVKTLDVKSQILDRYLNGELAEETILGPFNAVDILPLPGKPPKRGKLHHPVKHIMEQVYKHSEKSGSAGVDDAAKTAEEVRLKLSKIPMKVIAFSQDVRPPYYGTVTFKPFALGQKDMCLLARKPTERRLPLDYDYDSEAEWQEEEGEDLDMEDDEEEQDEEDDMDGFLDDAEDSGLSRRVFANALEPDSTGICFEDCSRAGPNPATYEHKLEFIHGEWELNYIATRPLTGILEGLEHTWGIDPFSTQYWEPEPKAKAPKSTSTSDAGTKMPPPPAPSNAFAALAGGATDAPKMVKPEILTDFKQAVLDNKELSKAGILAVVFQQFRDNASRTDVKNTLEHVAERTGKGRQKIWELKPGHEIPSLAPLAASLPARHVRSLSMEDPWGSPWTADAPPKVDLPAPPPHAHFTLDNSHSSPRASPARSPARSPWEDDENAWGAWTEPGRDSPGWGRSPGLKPVEGSASSRQPSPAPRLDPWDKLSVLETAHVRRAEKNVDSAISLGEAVRKGGEGDQDRVAPKVIEMKQRADAVWATTELEASTDKSAASNPEDIERAGSPKEEKPPGPAMSIQNRPEAVRQASKVQELVVLFDGIARRNGSVSPSEPGADKAENESSPGGSMTPDVQGIESEDEESETDEEVEEESQENGEDSSEVMDVVPQPVMESPAEIIPQQSLLPIEETPEVPLLEETLDEPPVVGRGRPRTEAMVEAPQAVVVEEVISTEATQTPPEPPLTPYHIDMSKLDHLFPSVDTSFPTPEPIPDVIIDDTFASITERKAWYRISRPDSIRKYDFADDEHYVRVTWAGSSVREQGIKIVRRWMEEDSFTGRAVPGRRPGAAGGNVFNWNSSAPQVEIAELFGRRSHSRQDSQGSKGTTGASPTAAAFGWSSASSPVAALPPPASDASPTTEHGETTRSPIASAWTLAPPMAPVPVTLDAVPRKAAMTSLAPVSRPISLVQGGISPTSPLGQPPVTAVEDSESESESEEDDDDEDEDDDDWGEMISSPTAESNSTIPPLAPLLGVGTSHDGAAKSLSLMPESNDLLADSTKPMSSMNNIEQRDSWSVGAMEPCVGSTDSSHQEQCLTQPSPPPPKSLQDDTAYGCQVSGSPNTRPHERSVAAKPSQAGPTYITFIITFFRTPNEQEDNKHTRIYTRFSTITHTHINPHTPKIDSSKDDEIVASILRDLPDLSYMLR